MKISLFWLFFAVEGGRYYAKMKAQKAAAKTQMMIRDADGVSFLNSHFCQNWVILESQKRRL